MYDEKPAQQAAGFAVAGLGKMGIMHSAMLGMVPGGRVAALVDANQKVCEHVRSMGIDAPTFDNLEACIDAVRPEGVVIATPQFTHRALFETCVEREVAVFCEKPLANTLEDARAMARLAAEKASKPVAVGFMLGHHPLFAQAAGMIADGVLGDVKSFKASCRLSQVFSPKSGWTFTRDQAGGGVLINSGCHLVYVLTMLFGRPRAVCVRGSGVHNEVEDSMAALIDYPSGVWGMLEVNWSVPGHDLQTHDVEVVGTTGTLEVSNETLRLWLSHKSSKYRAGWSLWPRTEVDPRADFSLSPDYCGDEFYLEIRDFVDAVRHGRAPKVGVDQALLVQEILDAMYRSMSDGRPIELAAENGTP